MALKPIKNPTIQAKTHPIKSSHEEIPFVKKLFKNIISHIFIIIIGVIIGVLVLVVWFFIYHWFKQNYPLFVS